MSDTIKRIDAAEFAADAATYLAAGEPLDIEQDGRVIGRYRPAPVAAASTQAGAPPPNGHATNGAAVDEVASNAEFEELSDRLQRTLDEIYARTGMTEEEFASYFDLTKPFPLDAPAKP